ncbi:hypothetical protein D3C76_709230 [compost metagenome]
MFAQFSLPYLSPQELQALSHASQCLERDANGPKVLRLADQDILKLFYPRKGLSLSRLFPAAMKFIRNARRLHRLGIPTVTVKQAWRLDGGVLAVLYQPVPGDSLRQLIDQDPAAEARLRPALASFIDHLHDRGVYFRSLHLGNIIRQPDGRFALIDISDMRFLRGPLRSALVRRNRAHFEHYVRKSRLGFDCGALWQISRNG